MSAPAQASLFARDHVTQREIPRAPRAGRASPVPDERPSALQPKFESQYLLILRHLHARGRAGACRKELGRIDETAMSENAAAWRIAELKADELIESIGKKKSAAEPRGKAMTHYALTDKGREAAGE